MRALKYYVSAITLRYIIFVLGYSNIQFAFVRANGFLQEWLVHLYRGVLVCISYEMLGQWLL